MLELDYIKELEEALTDVIDGESAYDLTGMTGLPFERCLEICKLFNNIMEKSKDGE